MTLEGKVVVITGSSRGIGRAIAQACAQAGAIVVVSSRSHEAASKVAEEIATGGGTASCVECDVADYAQVEALRDHALATHGHIDAWFNNAGISLGYEPLDEEPPEELAAIAQINLTGHLFGCRAILPYFREHGGHLVNMCGRGYRGEATPHTAAYAATKAAIASLTRSLAEENKDVANLSVNGFVPGMVDTDFYRNLRVSPRLEAVKDNWRFALDAFGVSLPDVGAGAVRLLSQEPGRHSGRIVSMLTARKTIPGIAKMAWWGMTGKLGKG